MADGDGRLRGDQAQVTGGAAGERSVGARIARAIGRARLAITWERLWPRLIPALLVAAAFLIVSWFGLWEMLPEFGRIIFLVLFGIAVLVALAPLFGVRMPGREMALARVETATGAPHRPATAFGDRLATGQDDPVARALWARNRERLLASLGRLRAGTPSPGVPRRDPYALRFLVILLLAVGFVYASGDRTGLISRAFEPVVEPVTVVAARIDAWAAPPAYTGRPPVFLTGEMARGAETALSLPTGTVVTVRIGGGAEGLGVIETNAAGETPLAATAPTRTPAGIAARNATAVEGAAPVEFRTTLTGETTVAIRRGEETVNAWTFAVVPDNLPVITPNGPPAQEESGALRLGYTVTDDYGVLGAETRFGMVAAADAGARPLYEPPNFPLTLPRVGTRDGRAQTVRDLTTHPWAGAEVRLYLAARDAAGQEGVSETVDFVLPGREFNSPLARALIEQRRNLALDALAQFRVASALDALTLVPERFIPSPSIYLGLRSAYFRTVVSRNDDQLREVVDLLWTIALAVEEGGLNDAAQELREAQDALEQALQDGAPPEEVQELMDQLREAMGDFMQALANQAADNPELQEQMQQQMQQNQQQQGGQSLEQMMEQMQQMAEAGDMQGAQEMLQQLQQMMQALQNGQMQAMRQQQQGSNPQMDALNELGEMIERQQSLMDQTYGLNQQGNEPGQGPLSEQEVEDFLESMREGLPGQQGLNGQAPLSQEQIQEFMERFRDGQQQRQQGLEDLQRQQQQLQEQLGDLMQELGEMGLEPGEPFGEAQEQMGQAQERLGQGMPGRAAENQNNALEEMRAGAQAMAEQMAEQQGQGDGQGNQAFRLGPAGPNGQPGDRNQDPLGRPFRTEGPDFGDQVQVPDEIDAQRARQILELIRRRLGEMGRPLEERNYLERLLDRY